MSQNMKVKVEVEVIGKDGVRKGYSAVERDLILAQFRNWLSALLYARLATINFETIKDVSGTDRTLYVRGDSTTVNLFNDTRFGAVGTRIGIGSDGTAPSRTQYELLSKIAEFDITTELVTESSIVKRGAWLATGSGTVRETGLYAYWVDSGGVVRQFLLFRDTPTPQSYVDGDSIQVTYTITL